MQDNLRQLVKDVFGVEARFDVSREADPGWRVVELPEVNYCMHVPDEAAELIPRLEKLMATVVRYEVRQSIMEDSLESVGNQLAGFIGSADKVMQVDGTIDVVGQQNDNSAKNKTIKTLLKQPKQGTAPRGMPIR